MSNFFLTVYYLEEKNRFCQSTKFKLCFSKKRNYQCVLDVRGRWEPPWLRVLLKEALSRVSWKACPIGMRLGDLLGQLL
jgi:hypothetical protein